MTDKITRLFGTALGIDPIALNNAARLYELRDGLRTLLGNEWPARKALWMPVIAAIAHEAPDGNVLAAVLSHATAMEARGEDPGVLLVMTCEYLDPTPEGA